MTNNSLSQKQLVLSIDIGTTSLKAAFVRGDGEVFSFKRIEYKPEGTNGEAFQESKSNFSKAYKGPAGAWLLALKEIFPNPLLSDCEAISISGNGPTIVSDNGLALLWCDKDEVIFDGDASFLESDLFERIDLPEAQKNIFKPRLLAFKKRFPVEWKEAKKFFPAPEWLCYYLQNNGERYGIPKGLPIFSAGPDFIAALIGTESLFAGRLCDRAGSSEGLNLCASKAVQEKNLRTMPSPAKGLWNLSCLIPDPGKSRQEKLDNFSKAFEGLKQAAAANGLDFGDTIMVTGGQALDQELLQAKANLCGLKICVAQISDAELLGSAAAAFYRLGKYSSLEEAAQNIVRKEKTFFPCGKSDTDGKKAFPQFYNIPKDLKAIIFDIDSTLYTNAAYAFEQVDCQVRQFASIRGISNDEARKMVSDYRNKYAKENGGKKISLSNILFQFGISIEQSVEWRRSLIEPRDFLIEDKKLQNALELLSKRFVLFCVTNNPILPAKKTLEALGIQNLIQDLIGLDTLNLSKPAKEIFLLAANKMGLDCSQIVSVGDRFDLDLAPALDLGMGGVLVSGVQDVYKLPDLL